MLGQLLRKKLDPSVEDWIRENTTRTQAGSQVNGAESHDGGLRNEDLRELWSWAATTSNSIVTPLYEDGTLDDTFTIAEREAGVENVVTGLNRNLDRDSEEDEDDDEELEEDKMEDVMPNVDAADKQEEGIDPSLPPMPLDSVLRFITTGTVPGSGRVNR
jgi:mediator of RNA polymerase II transcription subunit 8